ncbi:MAG TPA: ATP-binding protein [Polyangiaceae bacterium]|nr:ATP-binding protein [Polyangiaceae bacterium]
MAEAGLAAVERTWRVTVVALLLVIYRLSFFYLFDRIGPAAFLPAVVPCIAAGALLGVWGAVGTVAVLTLIDSSLAHAIGATSSSIGWAAMFVTAFIKLLLGIGAGVIAEVTANLRVANQKMGAEAQRRLESDALLEQSERKYRALVESLGEGVGLYDERDICVFANPALSVALRKEADSVVGEDFAHHFDSISKVRVTEHRTSKLHSTRSYEVVPKERAGDVLLVTETPLVQDTEKGDNKRVQTLRVVRDLSYRLVSERKQRDLERQLQRGQALQSLAVLAGGVAHDFNNLLSGIVGNAEFALRRVPRAAPIELTQCIEEIREFAGEATQLSRQMLAYAGRRSLAVGAVDVNVEINEALKLLHSTVEAQALLRLELADEVPQVKADRIQLRQVITNLVLNALESMQGSRGTLIIGTSSVEFDRTELLQWGVPDGVVEGNYVVIDVSDTGSGIPDDLKERIFEPFFSTKSPGRGMGLAASLGIMRSHHGWLGVDSTPGQGTRFRVFLPAKDESRESVRRLTPVDLKPVRAGKILLIDDEVAVRVVTNRLLVDLGQRVITAESGRRGIELFREQHSTIDLVLLDLTMPELTGAQVLDELRRIRKDVSVVVTSGFHPSNASDLLSLPNVVGFLEKPHNTANLEAIVATVFSN